MKPTAVIAGTPVDTRMGVEILKKYAPAARPLAFPVSSSPQETHLIQIAPEAEKEARFDRLFSEAESSGCRDFFLYCNSLSACFDFEALAKRRGDRIVTPLMIYRRLASRYSRLAVIAANSQAAAGIEKVLCQANAALRVCGLGYLPLVEAIEAEMPPEEPVRTFHLPELCRFFAANGAEALILGCTHFPYFMDALSRETALPLIDPAKEMALLLTVQ